jgi:hypothetical protein
MVYCKLVAYFVQECLLDHLLNPLHIGEATLPRHMAAHHRARPGRLHPLAGQGKPHGQHPVKVF